MKTGPLIGFETGSKPACSGELEPAVAGTAHFQWEVEATAFQAVEYSLSRQWLPINRIVADTAQSLLWMLFRQGRVDVHGALIDLQSLRIQPIRCDPRVWAGFGWQAAA